MLKSVGKLIISSDLPSPASGGQSPGTPEPSTPGGNTRPRKKLSFKEPEFFGYLKMRKPSFRKKPAVVVAPTSLNSPVTPTSNSCQLTTRVRLDEDPFEEEEENYEELESQAMRVVRTVGQAFEVCHKLSVNAAADDQDISIDKDRSRERSEEHLLRSEDYDDEMTHERQQTINRPRSSSPNVHKDISLSNDGEDVVEDQQNSAPPCILRTHGSSTSPIRQSPMENVSSECGDMSFFGGNELTALKHEIQLLRERLEQQSQQTCAAVGHARLLQDQLAAESAARVEAQARTHQLLIQNKELLEHIGALVNHLREQERASGAHGTVQPHNTGTGSAMNPQTPSVPNMPSLGQLQQRPTGQGGSSWELEAPSFTYSYTPEARFSNSGMDLHQGFATSTDQLHFQTQLLERLHNISPYQSQRSPYTTPSPYSMPAPSFLLSPSLNKPSNCTQPPSLPGLSVRVSQANSFASSPVMVHKAPLFSSQSDPLDSLTELHTFIKPLPCTLPRQRNTINASRELSISDKLQQQMQRSSCPNPTVMTSTNSSGSTTTNTTIILDPAPQGRRHESRVKLKNESPARENTVTDSIDKSNLVTILRAPGPPPSRTTSARLPARNDIMNQVQRKTWARHTTK